MSDSKSDLIKVDKAFSDYSKAYGVNKAFVKFAHDSAIILRENSYPIIGKEAIKELFSKPDKNYQLTWEPLDAKISQSNDLGFTYGIYTIRLTDSIKKGTYVSVWQNTADGWKYILDCGNDGLGE